MPKTRQTIPLALLLALLGSSGQAGETTSRPMPQGAQKQGQKQGLTGRVMGQSAGESAPLAAAGVYAYQVVDRSFYKVVTDRDGNFLFPDLPAGLYQVIAHKPGFVPMVVMISRATSRAFYNLQLELVRQRQPAAAAPAPAGDDFWSLRRRIPSDVLREIELAENAEAFAYSWTEPRRNRLSEPQGTDFRTDIQATTGVDQIADLGAGQMAGGQVGIAGSLGALRVGLSGRFAQMSPAGGTANSTLSTDGAQASALALDVAAGNSSRISVSSLNNRLFIRSRSDGPVDLEDYRLTWSQNLTENSRSEFRAQYTSENNFFRHGFNDPLSIPDYSNTWKVEGSYSTDFGDGNSLLAGVRYRERQGGLTEGDRSVLNGAPALASVDLWSRGNQRLHPRVVLEYGLYSTLSDGSLSLTPEGSMVFDLGGDWKLAAAASRRTYEDRRITSDFLPFLYAESDLCGEAGKECYQLRLTKASEEGKHNFSLSAASRTIGETLRLYFSDEFFDRLESLYLVPGDRIPELQLAVTRQISPQVVTTLESSLASGGGGTFQTPDSQSYENRVRYMVTSLDTRFKATSTGVFLALHHLSQNLDPVGDSANLEEMEFERLRLRLSQDLGFMMAAASDWTLQLNFELSRASSPYLEKEEKQLMRRILGGLAVKF